ncbi:methyltransferase domain-containing protein [Aliikangiella marina]|uniref:Methyltransferase domain-containing protein n=1 Tax=Aliikangiella marina TaxID=1712262 RepID=A0A545T545_9GAMM|nr:fused MFS/spermidine synthase [Aliikangiella marina]TQV72323.1 methyltransferase domain-containing protein [Aliikangiella marina]
MKKILLMVLAASVTWTVNAKEIVKERSIYRNVVIVEEGDLRCMRFETRRRQITNQACMDMTDSNRLVFEYAHGALAAYAINPQPKRILVLGLGGGTLSNVLHELSPEAEIVNVDIDPVVVKLAKQYFDYREDERVTSEIKDGRVYVKRAMLKKEKFDWIILDAFNGDYIPEHLMTREFLTEVKSLLNEGGVLSANTFSNSLLYDYESVTYQNVFGKLHIFKAPTKGNRVIFACNCDFEKFPEFDQQLAQRVKKYGVDLAKVWSRISDRVDWNTDSQILTDQYSPANLLKQQN